MTAKEVKFGDDARKKLVAGVNILANAIINGITSFSNWNTIPKITSKLFVDLTT